MRQILGTLLPIYICRAQPRILSWGGGTSDSRGVWGQWRSPQKSNGEVLKRAPKQYAFTLLSQAIEAHIQMILQLGQANLITCLSSTKIWASGRSFFIIHY